MNEILKKNVNGVGAKNIETLTGVGLVSVSAYALNVRRRLTAREKSVNINMALRYNSVEKKRLHVGTPVMTSEY